MKQHQIEASSGHSYELHVEEVQEYSDGLVEMMVEIDLQTFAESTFSSYTAAALLRTGRVFLLKAEGYTIGTCIMVRDWEQPSEVLLLSMGIRPGWRGRGLGQAFLGEVIEHLKSAHYTAIRVMVSPESSRAIRVYQERGFVQVGHTIQKKRTRESLLQFRIALTSNAETLAS